MPFVGKDTPSRASEFSHPDVVISLTILAYRYEGLRISDLRVIIHKLKKDMAKQFGPYHKREASRDFVAWIENVGAHVRGTARRNSSLSLQGEGREHESIDVWPLHLVDLQDEEQCSVLFSLLRRHPQVGRPHLDEPDQTQTPTATPIPTATPTMTLTLASTVALILTIKLKLFCPKP